MNPSKGEQSGVHSCQEPSNITATDNTLMKGNVTKSTRKTKEDTSRRGKQNKVVN